MTLKDGQCAIHVVSAVDRFVAGVGMELRTLMSWVYIGTLPHNAVEAFL